MQKFNGWLGLGKDPLLIDLYGANGAILNIRPVEFNGFGKGFGLKDIKEYLGKNSYGDIAYWTESINLSYKYNEPALLEDLRVYVDATYSEHYAQTSLQSTEVIIDSGHGVGFCLGNVLKYANRYGRKEGRNRKDLFKILHYTLIAIFIHDKEVK